MTVRVVHRLDYAVLECWGCSNQFRLDPRSPSLSVDEFVWDIVAAARRDGWAVCMADDDLFALCPSCVAVDLARLLVSLYHPSRESDSPPDSSSSDSPSARRLAGARFLASLLRRVADWLDHA